MKFSLPFLTLVLLFSCSTPTHPKLGVHKDTVLAYLTLPGNPPGTDSMILITYPDRVFKNDSSLEARWKMDTIWALGQPVDSVIDTVKKTHAIHFKYVLRLPDSLTKSVHQITIK